MSDCEADIIEQKKVLLFFNPHKFLVAINIGCKILINQHKKKGRSWEQVHFLHVWEIENSCAHTGGFGFLWIAQLNKEWQIIVEVTRRILSDETNSSRLEAN